MAKSTKSIARHLGGSKGKVLGERLKSADLHRTMIVPIEIGKRTQKALVRDYFGFIHRDPFTFHASEEGLRSVHKTISEVAAGMGAETVLVAMEATGHYYRGPAAALYGLGYQDLFIMNPASTAQFRKAGLVNTKTDDVDLAAITQALLCGHGTPYRPEDRLWDSLRELCRYRRFLVAHETALKNKIHSLLDQLLPGITGLGMFKDDNLWHRASLSFFTRHPSLQAVSRLRPAAVVQFFHRRGRRVTSEDAHRLREWSRQTLRYDGAANGAREQVLCSLLEELQRLMEIITGLEIDILGYVVRLPAVLLLTINYVGPVRAGEYAGEVGPPEVFPTSRAVVKAAGLDPTRYQTADYEAPAHPISKQGRIHLRYIVGDIGDALRRHNDYFAAPANKLLDRGKGEKFVRIAAGTRFVRVAFQMMKDRRPFEPRNGLGIHKDPLGKIAAFLRQREASERIEEYTALARRYLETTGADSTRTRGLRYDA
jgi:transposase